MRMILSCIYAVLSLILLIPVQLFVWIVKKCGNKQLSYRMTDALVPAWMSSILWVAGIKVKTTGTPVFPVGPAIYINNHQGLLDIPVMLTHQGGPKAMMSKAVIGKIPLLSGWMRLFDCIFVNRGNSTNARRAYLDAVALLKSGRSISLCPEGTRSKTGKVGAFKGGAFRMAAETGLPIVPTVLNGTRDLMEANHGRIKSGVVTVEYFDPIYVDGMTPEELAALPGKVHAMFEESVTRMQQEQKNKK